MPLGSLDPGRIDPRIGDVGAEALRASEAAIVNIDYPLGVAAYNILRRVLRLEVALARAPQASSIRSPGGAQSRTVSDAA